MAHLGSRRTEKSHTNMMFNPGDAQVASNMPLNTLGGVLIAAMLLHGAAGRFEFMVATPSPHDIGEC